VILNYRCLLTKLFENIEGSLVFLNSIHAQSPSSLNSGDLSLSDSEETVALAPLLTYMYDNISLITTSVQQSSIARHCCPLSLHLLLSS